MSIFREKRSPYRVFDRDISRARGEAVLRINILAIKVLAEMLKTTLGPRGMDKIVVETSGEWFVTNDGATILQKIDVRHPAAKLLIEVAKAQDKEVGDGTTSAVILAGELLSRALYLLQLKLHPSIIINGYKRALDIALKEMNKRARAVSLNDHEILERICKTSLMSKNLGFATDHIVRIAINAFQKIVKDQLREISIDKENVLIVKKLGKSLSESILVEGIVIDKGVAHPLMPKRVVNAKIALISSPLKIEKAWCKAELVLRSMADIKQIVEEEIRYLKENVVEKILKIGANVILCENEIDEIVQALLAKNNIMAVKRVRTSDMWRLTKATGGKLVASLKDLSEADLGIAGTVEEIKIGHDKLVLVKDCPKARSVSILLRAGSKRQLDEAERALNDALMNLITLTSKLRYVPGGGAIEMALASIIRKEAKKYPNKEQLPMLAFADSLEVIPRTLADNAGMDSTDVLMRLRSMHEKGDYAYGIEANSKKLVNMFEAGILEPVKLKEQVLKNAFEIASMILRVDDIYMGLDFFEKPPEPEDKNVPPISESEKS